ncbi:MAG: hypothetical protein PHT91_01145 [Candidatus Nanoarchaeia archaeon]|nr:hypothetical protein [Candidatus Nanoarchaeia archaeon]MDD5054046.1 hypothetical protein [Candidatus Nanoarchaeia archaeon]MDD5499464.1 hypothetical protein [Candidatus Nanoarchaeia archaeon]
MPYQGRDKRNFSGGNRFGGGGQRRDFGGPRQMYKTTCSECGKEAEVPFKPKEGLPVYCRDCYMKRKENPGSTAPKAKKERVEEDIESDEEEF